MTKLMGEHMNRREIDTIVKEADDNGDGTVDFEGKWQTNKQNKQNKTKSKMMGNTSVVSSSTTSNIHIPFKDRKKHTNEISLINN